MRLRQLLILLCAALALCACARQRRADTRALRTRCADVRRAAAGLLRGASRAQVVPVAATSPEGPYTLDSGDKLRIVVFGQDSISNNYTVDAQGAVTLPLIGAVTARGLTTVQLGNTSLRV